MNKSRRALAGFVLYAAILLWASCIFTSHSFSEDAAGGNIKFELSASGLPDKGMWKCTPAVTRIGGHTAVALVPLHGNGPEVFLRNEAGQWVESSQGIEKSLLCGGSAAFGELTRSGCPDLVVADHCSGVSVYLGDCKGNWKQVVKGLAPAASQSSDTPHFLTGAESVAIGDVNEDGCPDLVVGSSDMGGINVYLGDCSGVNWKESPGEGLPSAKHPGPNDEGSLGGWANRLLLVDINKDGHLDIVASYFKGPRVWLGDGKGNWKPSSAGLPEPTIYGIYRSIAVGDVNEDGLLDIAVTNEVNGLEVYLQKPDGSWQATADPFFRMQGGALALDLADLDKDGHLDLVVGGRMSHEPGSAYGLFVLKGDGKGGFKYDEAAGLPATGLSTTWGIKAVDLDGNGFPNIIAATGGVVPGSDLAPHMDKMPEAWRAKAAAAKPPVAEAQLPRMQLWTNKTDQSTKK